MPLQLIEKLCSSDSLDHTSRIQILQEVIDSSIASFDVQQQLGVSNAFSFCISCLSTRNNDEGPQVDVIVKSFWALVHLNRRVVLDKSTTCKENQVLSNAFIKDIVECVEANAGNADIVHPACVLMMILASDNDENQQALGNNGATKAVINVLLLHPTNELVLEFALRCVRNFSALEEVACKLTEDGVGEQLQKILQSSPVHSVAVLEAATWAVVNLSYDEDVAALLGSVGCCSAILSAYPEGTSQTASGRLAFCWAVRNLACPSLNIDSFAKSAVADIILDILKTNGDDWELLNAAIWCINNLSCSLALLKAFHALNVSEVLLTVCRDCMASISDDRELGPIAEATIFTLRSLASAVPKEQPIDTAAVESVESSGESSSPAAPTAAVEEEVSENVHQSKLGALGAIELVRDILLKYIDREGMVENSFNTLASLCRQHAANQQRALDVGVLDAVYAATKQHRDVLDTVEIGLKCLLALIYGSEQCCDRVCQNNGVAFVVEYMRHWRTDYDVCTVSCELLLHLHYRGSEVREELKAKTQLTDDLLHARPAGRFEDIAAAWKIDELLPIPIDSAPETSVATA